MSGEARIGTCGLERAEVAGRGAGELPALGQLLSTVEISSTFQRTPSGDQLARWAASVPPGFQFALKIPRKITHDLRLTRVAARPLDAFVEAASELGEHLGPLLVQLPPDFSVDVKALTDFLRLLPQGPRFAFEFRHPSWNAPAVMRVLSAHEAALVVSDEDEDSPTPRFELTADFAYVRLRREHDDGQPFWDAWASRLAALTRRGVDVYAFVKHDRRGAAVDRARRLAALLRNEESYQEQSLLT